VRLAKDSSRLDPVRLALGTLTVLPTGAVRVTPSVARGAMLLAPVVVLPLAAVAVGTGWLGRLAGWPSLVNGLIVVAALALGTRALHLDGLADTVDGLGSGRPAEQALEIMRRGDVGPMGVVALVVVLGLQAAACGALLGVGSWLELGLLICGSRLALPTACARGVPAARSDGLGAAVVGTVPRSAAAVGWLVFAAVLCLVSNPWWLGGVTALVGSLSAVALTAYLVRRLGGITGDTLGAEIELTLTAMLLVALL
jgi:adenosylcobinamide-GDP ribazoletransferase